MPHKPRPRQAVNVTVGKTSYLLIRAKGDPLAVYDAAHPALGSVYSAVVSDADNSFYFSATPVTQADATRLALKLVSQLPGGGADPTDGLLTITLNIVNTLTTVPPGTAPLPVTDVPVDYISDPAAP
jgi:hypothetical protein